MVVAVALFALACGGSSPGVTATAEVSPSPEAATGSGGGPSEVAEYDFPTGEAILVAAGYTHPDDRVDNTGAYLPANGKPTLVFVDAIW
jgi:hypothetical protein